MKWPIFMAALALLLPITVFAQNATVGGTVSDASGALIPGVELTATNVNTGIADVRVTNETGSYNFASVQPGSYRVSASLPGFQTQTFQGVQLSQSQQVRLNFTLEVAQVGLTIEVTTDAQAALAATSASIGSALPDIQIQSLPLAVRDVTALIETTAGAVGDNFGGVNAGNVNTTRDGLAVGDSRYLREHGVIGGTFVSPDLVEEIQVVTTSVDAASGRGSGQVRLQTRSGTNEFHGAVFYTNNNSGLNAQNWFNNLAGRQKSYLNRNQYGGRLGGPIIRNKAFFFVLIDNQRYLEKESVVASVLTPLARQGIFRYMDGRRNANALSAAPSVDLSGNVLDPARLRSFNLFSDVRDPFRTGMTTSPYWRNVLNVMPPANDFTVGDGLNTAGHRFLRRYDGRSVNNSPGNNSNRDQLNLRFDYQVKADNRLSMTHSREANSATRPPAWPNAFDGVDDTPASVLTAGWTWTITPTVLNEFRFGRKSTAYNLLDPFFLGCCLGGKGTFDLNDGARKLMDSLDQINGYPVYPVSSLLGTNIANHGFGTQRGNTNPTVQFSNNLSWTRRSHSFTTGFEWIHNWTDAWNMTAEQFPRADIGSGSAPVQGITSTRFPGLQAADAVTAEDILNNLVGSIGQLHQGFLLNSATQKEFHDWKVEPRRFRHLNQEDWAVFFKDTLNVTNNLTLNLGVRYDKYGVLYEKNGMAPQAKGGEAGLYGISGPVGLTEIQLVGKNSTNPNLKFWPEDWNNVAPSLGFSYKVPWLDRTTVIRGGYGINYSGQVTMLDYELGFFDMPGAVTIERPVPSQYLDFATAKSRGVFPLSPSARPFQAIPVTSDRTQVLAGNADRRRTPYIQSFNLSVQRELARGLTLDVAYVGNKATKLLDAIELNEANIFENGILDAFSVTRAGGDAELFNRILMGLNVPGVGRVDGVNLTGSQAFRRSALTRGFFANGSVAQFAQFLNTSPAITRQAGGLLRNAGLPENFIALNPQFGRVILWDNSRNSIYHSMQVQLRKGLSHGFSGQLSYTFSKALGDGVNAVTEGQASLRTGLTSIDPRNRARNKGRVTFDRQHVFNAYGTWELPFGPGRAVLSGTPNWVHRIVEGWQLSTITKYASGAPLTITSPVRTVGVASNTNVPDLVGNFPKSVGEVRVGNGFVEYFEGISTRTASATGFGSDPDNLARFVTNRDIVDRDGNVLLRNPQPGVAGNLGVGWIEGPGRFGLDLSLSKRVRIGERTTFTLRADAVNFLNTPQWGNPNTNVNATTFGRITSATGERTVTMNARIDF